MDALAILQRLELAEISITVAGDRLRLTPGSRVPTNLLQAIRKHKPEFVRTLLVLREAEVVALQAEARYHEAEVRELRVLATTLGQRPGNGAQ